MPKNTKGGNKAKKGRNSNAPAVERQLELKSEDQDYARVVKLLGDCRLSVTTESGHKRVAIIRGKFHKKVWIKVHDIVLVALRGYQDDRVDVIHRYDESEVNQLKKLGEIELVLKDREDQVDGDGNQAVEEDQPFDFTAI